MRNQLNLIIIITLFLGCNILNDENNTNQFKSINTVELEAFMAGEISTGYSFEVADDSGNVFQVSDSLRFTWTANNTSFHSYANADEAIIDSLESASTSDPNLVYSQEQIKLTYSIAVDSSSIIGDTTFVFINDMDTSTVSVTAAEMQDIYSEAALTFFESDSIYINNFDVDNNFQRDALGNFRNGVQFSLLTWLPDPSFVPQSKFFRIEESALVNGAFENTEASVTYNEMQNAVITRFREFIERE